MQYALIFYDLQLILAPMPLTPGPGRRRTGERSEPRICRWIRWTLACERPMPTLLRSNNFTPRSMA